MSIRTDKLYYPNSDTEICLGDRISIRRWFRKREGTITYMPGVSERHPSLESKDGSFVHWGISLDHDKHNILMLAYFPPEGVVPKSLRLIRRSKKGEEIHFMTPSESIQ